MSIHSILFQTAFFLLCVCPEKGSGPPILAILCNLLLQPGWLLIAADSSLNTCKWSKKHQTMTEPHALLLNSQRSHMDSMAQINLFLKQRPWLLPVFFLIADKGSSKGAALLVNQQQVYELEDFINQQQSIISDIGMGNILKFNCIAIWLSIPSNTFLLIPHTDISRILEVTSLEENITFINAAYQC